MKRAIQAQIKNLLEGHSWARRFTGAMGPDGGFNRDSTSWLSSRQTDVPPWSRQSR